MNSLWLKRAGLFVLALLLMLALVVLRNENEYDRQYYRAQLNKGQQLHCVLDLGQEGYLKYWLQPEVYTLYLRLELQEQQVQLYCESEGLQVQLSQNSKKGIWNQLQPHQLLQRRRGVLPLSLELRFPKATLRQYKVQQGRLNFYDEQGLYASIDIEVVNSRYRK